jgi:hypothetical protein
MECTQDREVAVPALAERARTLAARSRTATVVAAGTTDRPMPILYQVHRDRTAVLLLAMDCALPTLAEVAPGGEVSAMLELTDVAPVALREPVRGLLWITGWLRTLPPDQARRASVRCAEQRPDSRLLDVGHTANILWLDPVFAVFSDGEGTGWLIQPPSPTPNPTHSVGLSTPGCGISSSTPPMSCVVPSSTAPGRERGVAVESARWA